MYLGRSNILLFLYQKEYKCCCGNQDTCCWDSCPTDETKPPDACGLDNINKEALKLHDIRWEEQGDSIYSLKATKGLIILKIEKQFVLFLYIKNHLGIAALVLQYFPLHRNKIIITLIKSS